MAAGFNIAQFLSHVNKTGVMRNNKFLIRIPTPRGLIGDSEFDSLVNTARYLEFWAESSSLPGATLSIHSIMRYGYGAVEKKPTGPAFTDQSTAFIADANAAIWSYFYKWLNMITNFNLSHGIVNQGSIKTGQVSGISLDPYELSYKSEYAVDIEITLFDDNGQEKMTTVLREAFPIHLGDLPLNWADNNSYMKIPLVFTFFDWYSQLSSLTVVEQ